MHQKWYKNGFGYENGQLEKITQNIQTDIYLQYSRTYMSVSAYHGIQHGMSMSTLREPTKDIL